MALGTIYLVAMMLATRINLLSHFARYVALKQLIYSSKGNRNFVKQVASFPFVFVIVVLKEIITTVKGI